MTPDGTSASVVTFEAAAGPLSVAVAVKPTRPVFRDCSMAYLLVDVPKGTGKGADFVSQLQVEAQGATSANPDAVWALVVDANSYPQWGPWNDGGYRPPAAGPSREGSVLWFRYGRRTISVERILEVEAPRRLVYTVVKGLPVRNYRAEVTLTPTLSDGTSIRWAATWDSTFMGKLVRRKLRKVYVEVVNALVAATDPLGASEPNDGSAHPHR